MQETANSFELPAITPFWQRLPRFFLYPLHAEPLGRMGLLALATLIGFWLPLESPYDHAVAHIGVWLAFIRYAYRTLDQTAQGWLTPDAHRAVEAAGRVALPYKQFVILVLLAGVLSLALQFGSVAFGAALVFCTLALPASVMILSIKRSFWSAINPLGALAMMRAIGLPYLGLWALVALLLAGKEIVQRGMQLTLPPLVLLPALNFVAMYFTLVMFNTLGYVIYQYHSELGVSVAEDAT